MVQLEYCPVVGNKCNKPDVEIVFKDVFFLAEPFKPLKAKSTREIAIKNALKEALGNSYSESSLQYADKEPRDTAIFCEICRKIQSSEFGIVDLSGLIPNVMVELGMMLAFGKPVFLLAKTKEKEKIERKLPSDLIWKRAISYDERYISVDLNETLVEALKSRAQLSPKPLPPQFVLDKPIADYDSIKKWFSKLGKRSNGVSKERKKEYGRKMMQYCMSKFVGMNPDLIIEDAICDSKLSGFSKAHSQRLKDFLDNLNARTKITYYNEIKSFYTHNGIELRTQSPEYHVETEFWELNKEEIQKILEEAPIEHKSWIIANSYMGLGVGSLMLLTVADFHVGKWINEEPPYPVRIRKEVNKNKFAYTTYIGSDAKDILEKFFDDSNFNPTTTPWGSFPYQTFSNKFTELARRAQLISESKGKIKSDAPNRSPLTSKSLGKRLERILIKYGSQNLVTHIMGCKPDKSQKSDTITDYEVKEVYKRALDELKIY